MWQSLTVTVAMCVAAAACAPALSNVPVAGSEVEIAQLAGEWEGEYTSAESGRSGSVVFRLTAGRDTAQGDVLMMPRERPGVAAGPEAAPSGRAAATAPQLLTITFVRVADGRVSGTLDPYDDPDCGCAITTTFVGELRGDRIEGTFYSRGGPTHTPQSGTWQVRRRPGG